MALTKEFAVIQGPPGTGKTYIGLKVGENLKIGLWVKDIPHVVIQASCVLIFSHKCDEDGIVWTYGTRGYDDTLHYKICLFSVSILGIITTLADKSNSNMTIRIVERGGVDIFTTHI